MQHTMRVAIPRRVVETTTTTTKALWKGESLVLRAEGGLSQADWGRLTPAEAMAFTEGGM